MTAISASVRRRLERVMARKMVGSAVIEPLEEFTGAVAANYHIASRRFVRWMDAHGRALPAQPEDVLANMETWTGLAHNTCRFRLTAIRALHVGWNVPDPTKDPRVRGRLRAFRDTVRGTVPSIPRGTAPTNATVTPDDEVARLPDLAEPARLGEVADAAARIARSALAPETVAAYRFSFAVYRRWCAAVGEPSLPTDPDTLRRFFVSRGDATAYSTMRNYASAVSWTHRVAGHPDPTRDRGVRELLALAKRAHKVQPAERISPAEVRTILATLGDEPLDRRDGAFVLLVLGGSLKYQDVVNLDRSRIEFVDDGVLLHLGPDEAIFVGAGSDPQTDPVRALRRWLEVIGTGPGPLFPSLGLRGGFASVTISARGGRRIIKRLAERAGLDAERFTIMGIRRGFLRAAAAAGVPASSLMVHARLNLNSVLKHTGNVGEPFALAAVTRRARRAKGATRT